MKKELVSFASYLPRYFVDNREYTKYREEDTGKIVKGLEVEQRRKANLYENSLTMGYEAAKRAITRGRIDPGKITSVYYATESPVDAVAPATELIDLLDLNQYTRINTITCTCAAGVNALIEANPPTGEYSLVIASDTAQAEFNDALEYTVGDGATAFIISNNPGEGVATLENHLTISKSLKDFWRKPGHEAPSHMGPLTGKAYKELTIKSMNTLLDKYDYDIHDFKHIGMHSPFPKIYDWCAREDKKPVFEKNPLKDLMNEGLFYEKLKVAKSIGRRLGNPYAATASIITIGMLEESKNEDLLYTSSFGSGATCTGIVLKAREGLEELVKRGETVKELLKEENSIKISAKDAYKWNAYRLSNELPQFKKIDYEPIMKEVKCNNVNNKHHGFGKILKTGEVVDKIFRNAVVENNNGSVKTLIAGCKLPIGTFVEPVLACVKETPKGPKMYEFVYREKKQK